jgi:2'-5' RNA ligase
MSGGWRMQNWEEWQYAYRFGVVLILPPEPVRSRINALRGQYDPRSQSWCDAHVSLTVPLPRAPEASDWVELEAAALAVRSFSVHYGPLKPFLPNPGAAFHVEPQAEIDSLRRSLEASAIFANAAPRKYQFWAHMTVAEFISAEMNKELLADSAVKNLSGSFVCDRLWHMIPDDKFHFVEQRQLNLI